MHGLKLMFIALWVRIHVALGMELVAKPTKPADNEDPLGWTPMPTSGPMDLAHGWLNKRADFTSLCGYVSGAATDALTCRSGYNCGFNTVSGAFGCCTSVVGTASLTGCNFFSACNDMTVGCNAACSSNSRQQFCASSTAPYCVQYSLYAGSFTFTNWGCAVSRTAAVQVYALSSGAVVGSSGAGSVAATSSLVPSSTRPVSSSSMTVQPSFTSSRPVSSNSMSAVSVSSTAAPTTSAPASSASLVPFGGSQASASNGVPTQTVTLSNFATSARTIGLGSILGFGSVFLVMTLL